MSDLLVLRDEDSLTTTSLAGSIVELLLGTAAVAASAAGLDGRNAPAMAAWAAISIGIAFLARGLAVKARVESRNRLPIQYEHKFDRVEPRIGVTGKVIAGVVGIGFGLLGLLALPTIAFAVALFGIVLVLGAHDQLELARQSPDRGSIGRYTAAVIHASLWVTAIAGTFAFMLGAGAVWDHSAPMLSFVLVATLAVGIAQAVAGLALSIRFGRHLGVAPVSA